MDSNIGNRIEPFDGCRSKGAKIAYGKPCQKIFFDIANAAFHPALFIAFSHRTGRDGKTVVIGKIKVFGVGGGGGNTISRMREIGIKGGEFTAVNTDAQDLLYTNADFKLFGYGAKSVKGVLVAGKKVLHGL